MKAATETALVRQLIDYLKLIGILAWRVNTTGLRRRTRVGREFWAAPDLVGISDILGCLPGGRLLTIEAKMPGRWPTPAQDAFLAAVQDAGGLAVVCHSLAELETCLREEGVIL